MKIIDKVQIIDESAEGLTDWEIQFIADMVDGDIRHHSEKQIRIIEDLYERKVSFEYK